MYSNKESHLNKKRKVIFVTSVFKEAREGPAVYANYLWEHFKDSEYFDFHLVAPESGIRHENIHVSGLGSDSLDTYKRLQEKALVLAHGSGSRALVHGNAAHSMYKFSDYAGPLIVQVNDYDPADILKDSLEYFTHLRFRRYASLFWRRFNESKVLKVTDCILCNSAYTRTAVLRSYGVEERRCRVLYKAVATENFKRPSPLPPDPFNGIQAGSRLVFIGTNWRRKGLDLLLRALPDVAAGASDVSLTVIGANPDSELHTLIKKYDLESRVHFMGRVERERLPAMLWHSTLVVLPSRKEALGVAVLEAMAAGVPVVATRVGGIPEIISDAGSGCLVEPDNAKALSAAIGRLLSDKAELERLAQAGIKRAADFSRQSMLRNLECVYGEVMDEYEHTRKYA